MCELLGFKWRCQWKDWTNLTKFSEKKQCLSSQQLEIRNLANQCQMAFAGTLGIRPGGPLGHAKTPEEEEMATLTNEMVSMALNRVF